MAGDKGQDFEASLHFRLFLQEVEALAGHMHLLLGAFCFVSILRDITFDSGDCLKGIPQRLADT